MTTSILHPKFLEESSDYDASVREWRTVWDSIDAFAREYEGWAIPWVDESMRDGNPILSAWSEKLRRGIRIIQHQDPNAFVVWRGTFASGTPDAVEELVIDTALTIEHLAQARELIADWVRGSQSPGIVRVRPLESILRDRYAA